MKETISRNRKFQKLENKQSNETVTTTNIPRRKYYKITNSMKRSLIRLVADKNCSIKKASQLLNLSYSSSKMVILDLKQKFTTKLKTNRNQLTLECTYKEVKLPLCENIIISSSTGSQIVSQQYMAFKLVKMQEKMFSQQPVETIKDFLSY